jgi:predicted RND superfamily exporter protein
MKKIYITALVIVLFLVVFLLANNNKKTEVDFYVSKFAPNSLAYFVCRSEGMQEGNKCKVCEDIFKDTDSKRKELNIETDIQLIEKVKEINADCVSKAQGGN